MTFAVLESEGAVERMSRYIDIEPYEKDGWYLQKRYHNSYGEVIKTAPLVSVPTAEAEPKHGKWVLNRQGNWACSLCGNDPYHSNMHNMNYCPNCGAKMDEVGE